MGKAIQCTWDYFGLFSLSLGLPESDDLKTEPDNENMQYEMFNNLFELFK